jgi:hypothetical protein
MILNQNHFSPYGSGLFDLERKLNKETGTNNLKKNPANIDNDPNPKQIKCSCKVNGTVFKDCPPYSTHKVWIIMVATKIIKNNGLLKKFLNTFN